MDGTTCDESWMTPGQVATLFRVDPRTVRTRRWDQILGEAISRTLGGHRRYSEPKVHAILQAASAASPQSPAGVAAPPASPGRSTTQAVAS